VVDNREELEAINTIAAEKGKKQPILLRLTPGIDPHTYEAVATGKVDSKFGTAIETGQALEMVEYALGLANIELKGFHCHVGSQLMDEELFCDAATNMLKFIGEMGEKYGFLPEILNLGGGMGVPYTEDQPQVDYAENIRLVGEHITRLCKELSITPPVILMEPGRSIVADAALTVYTVGTVKHIPGYKSYVSVDGGMTDNPRFALYKSPYTVVPVGRDVGDDTFLTSIVGRCCESGDILQENQVMPSDIARGEYIACLVTGAYNYSMASNYNRIPRPPVVMLSGGVDRLAVRRETVEDIIRLDI
jgi:diaminopimelate decarboxylase